MGCDDEEKRGLTSDGQLEVEKKSYLIWGNISDIQIDGKKRKMHWTHVLEYKFLGGGTQKCFKIWFLMKIIFVYLVKTWVTGGRAWEGEDNCSQVGKFLILNL